jgi:2',3'-cyclic-nucleotide 2'-phosphodiesterase (5'-nucleotidase family)
MGAILTDCLISEQQNLAKPIEIAVINGAGIRAQFPAGEISQADVFTVLPFGNSIVNWEWTGVQVKALLERVAAGGDDVKKIVSAPQFSGVAFTYNTSLPVGSRVISAKIGESDLVLTKIYQISSIDIMVISEVDNIVSPGLSPAPPVIGKR